MGPPGGPIFGTVFRFIFVKFASGLKKRNVLVSTETLWLMATRKATEVTLKWSQFQQEHFCEMACMAQVLPKKFQKSVAKLRMK